MKSMTGFAALTEKNISFKIKSVNHRFFDLRLHAPQDFLVYEKEIRQKINQCALRGSVDLFIQVQFDKKAQIKKIDIDKAKSFYKDLKKMASSLKIDLTDELSNVLKFGDVFESSELSDQSLLEQSDLKKTDFLVCIEKLVKEFDKERIREGKALASEIKTLLQSLEKVRSSLEDLAKNYPQEIELKIKDKLKLWKSEFDPERLNQELLLLIDKSDIKEEIVRLKEHIKACLNLLSSPLAEGKKLDFYAQELFREVNTIGSKSSSVKITGEVMEAKAIIEKIRQQVQNIE